MTRRIYSVFYLGFIIGQASPEKHSQGVGVHVERDGVCKRQRYRLKELPYVVTEAGKSKLCRVGWQVGDPGKSACCSSSPKAICCRIPSCLGEAGLCSIQAFN